MPLRDHLPWRSRRSRSRATNTQVPPPESIASVNPSTASSASQPPASASAQTSTNHNDTSTRISTSGTPLNTVDRIPTLESANRAHSVHVSNAVCKNIENDALLPLNAGGTATTATTTIAGPATPTAQMSNIVPGVCDTQYPLLVGNRAQVTPAGPGLAPNPRAQGISLNSATVPDNSGNPGGSIFLPDTLDANTAIHSLQRGITWGNQEDRLIDLSQQLWGTALSRLQESDREILRIHIDAVETQVPNAPGTSPMIEGLVQSVEQRRNEIRLRRGGILTFSWNGRVFNLTNVMDNIISWAERFKAIGDIIVQYDPGHMALPWAAARFLLQIMTEDRANMAAITIAIERVTNISTLSAIYTGMYLSNRILSADCSSRLEASLVKLHTHVLSILAHALGYLKYKRSMVRSLFEYDTFADQLRDIDRSLQDLRDDVDIAEREIMNLNHQWQQATYSKLKSLLHGLGHSLEKLERSAEALEKELQENKRNDLLAWISTCAYKRNHRDLLGGQKIMENTGMWLFDSKEYLDWLQTPESSIFWLNGNPGMGKSYLTYAAIELLQETSWKTTMSYFYCSRRDNDKTRSDPEAIVRALLKALLMESGIDPERIFLETRYKNRNADGELKLEEATRYLIELFKQPECDNSIIFIDALDEVDKRDRIPLLLVIGDILMATNAKIWIASRPELDIQRALLLQIPKRVDGKNAVRDVPIAKRNLGEIAAYIEREVDARIETGELLDGDVDDDTRQLIIRRLKQKGDGMYLWVHLQILSLCDLTHIDHVQHQLENLPQGLENTYRLIYDNIRRTPNLLDQSNATHILKWLCVATPLKFSDLAQLIGHTNSAFNIKAPPISDVNYLRKLCYNLVVVDSQQEEVRLVHLSVREFLETECVGDLGWKDFPHQMAVKACLHHLLASHTSSLMPYIVHNWARHYGQAMDSSHGGSRAEIVNYTQKFLQEAGAHKNWLDKLSDDDLSGDIDALFTIARYNLYELLPEVISNPILFNINAAHRNTAKETPLHLAVKFGHLEIVKSIVGSGTQLVEVNAQDQYGRTPLSVAINRKNHVMVEYLLTCSEIELNIADDLGGYTPLVRAAWLEDEIMVKILLSESTTDADSQRRSTLNLNASDHTGRTACHWAVLRGKPGIIQVLGAAGADINAQDGISKMTPLCTWAMIHYNMLAITPYETQNRLLSSRISLERYLKVARQLCDMPNIDPNLAAMGHGPNTPMGYLLGALRCVIPEMGYLALDGIKILLSTVSFNINLMATGSPPCPPVFWAIDQHVDRAFINILLEHKPPKGQPRLNVNALTMWSARPPHSLLSFWIMAYMYNPETLTVIQEFLESRYSREIDFQSPIFDAKLTYLQFSILNNLKALTRALLQAELGFANNQENLGKKFFDENWARLHEAAKESHEAVLKVCDRNVEVSSRHLPHAGSIGAELWKYWEAHSQVRLLLQTALRAVDDTHAQQQLQSLNVNVRDLAGCTALHYVLTPGSLQGWNHDDSLTPGVLEKHKYEVARVLLATPGIDVNVVSPMLGTPLGIALSRQGGDSMIFDMLLATPGIDVNVRSDTCDPAITNVHSSEPGRWSALATDNRTNLNVFSSIGYPPIVLCAGAPTLTHLLRVLLESCHGRVDPNLPSRLLGCPALSVAASNSNYAAVEMLLEYPGINLDNPDQSLDTPLIHAARGGDEKIVRALLRKKATLNWRNYEGLTAMEIAVGQGNVKIVELLNQAADGTVSMDDERE